MYVDPKQARIALIQFALWGVALVVIGGSIAAATWPHTDALGRYSGDETGFWFGVVIAVARHPAAARAGRGLGREAGPRGLARRRGAPRTIPCLRRPPTPRVTVMATQGARAAAVAVHVYTATGVVLALLMVHFSYQGDVEAVLWLFLAAMVVDGTDGMLARRLHVKTVVPNFDGALLDNIVDYITYAFAPMVLLWANGYLPDGAAGGVVAAIPLLASCYQFCRTDAKTDDHFFLGFPSYWNVVAFYAIVCSFRHGRHDRGAAGLRRAGLRAGQVPLPLAHREALVRQHGALGGVARAVRRDHRADARPAGRRWSCCRSGYVVYYVAVSLWLTFSPSSAHPASRSAAESAPRPSHS